MVRQTHREVQAIEITPPHRELVEGCSLEFRLFQQPAGREAFELRRQGRIRSQWRIKGKVLVLFE
jgi:hypothetical protein